MSQLPGNYNWLMKDFADVMKAHQQLGKELKNCGPLDEKTIQLVQLAGAATSRSQGAVHSHTKRALEAGASPEEIFHTLLLLTSTVGFPTIAAALSWVKDTIEQ